MTRPFARAEAFCRRFGLTLPVLQAPMAGVNFVALSAAVANAGGMGGMGALVTPPEGILRWAADFRAQSQGKLQLNIWIPDPPAERDPPAEKRLRAFLADWGPPAPQDLALTQDFSAQCETMLEAAPAVISSIMGLFPADYVRRFKAKGISWF